MKIFQPHKISLTKPHTFHSWDSRELLDADRHGRTSRGHAEQTMIT